MISAADAEVAGATCTRASESNLLLHKCVRVLLDAGERLRLPQETIATAVMIFHRFFAERSLSVYHANQRLDVVLMTCLFLAAKVEEQPRRIRDAINCVYFAQRRLETLSFHVHVTADVADEDGDDAGGVGASGKNGGGTRKQDETRRGHGVAAAPRPEAEDAILPLDRKYWEMKESVVDTEQLVLRVLGFDLDTYRPYRILLNYARSLRARPVTVEVAWSLLNDSLFSPAFCLIRPSQAQAVAVLHLAQRILKVQEQEEEETEKQQQQQETGKTMQLPGSSSSSQSVKPRKHTIVISSSTRLRSTSSEMTVNRDMWAVLGAKAEDVIACSNDLLMLYEEGIESSSSAWQRG